MHLPMWSGHGRDDVVAIFRLDSGKHCLDRCRSEFPSASHRSGCFVGEPIQDASSEFCMDTVKFNASIRPCLLWKARDLEVKPFDLLSILVFAFPGARGIELLECVDHLAFEHVPV